MQVTSWNVSKSGIAFYNNNGDLDWQENMAALLNKEQIVELIGRGSSHTFNNITGYAVGMTKFQVFLAIRPLLSDMDYWFALREAYDMSDNLFHYRDDVKLAFNAAYSDKEYLMTEDEREHLRKLPEKIKIYRCMTDEEFKSGDFGVSWTLDKKVAAFFAENYERNYGAAGRPTMVHELTITKMEVIAYFNERQEQEIIYLTKRFLKNSTSCRWRNS